MRLTTFKELYSKLLSDTVNQAEFKQQEYEKYDFEHLDCLLYPKKHPPIWHLGQCDCSKEQQRECAERCPFGAIEHDENGRSKINGEKCVSCSFCIDQCRAQNLVASRDIIPVLKEIQNKKSLVYALIAPAFLGQFTKEVTPAKLRTALKKIGFDGMIEVSLFADILTLKESLEFIENIKEDSDFQLTSCCCPIWIAMIKKLYSDLLRHVPSSVSPMIAGGRAIKRLYDDAVTVFIGPCIAKKSEAKEEDIAGAVDYVLTFQEADDIFKAMNINPAEMEESFKDHSSRAGRIYARTGGVSEAVKATVRRLKPEHPIPVQTKQADGVPACKAMINDLVAGKLHANFYEGMGCVGGCVGGPKSVTGCEEGTKNVNEYAKMAAHATPIDNPYVIELLHRLGFDDIESLLKDSDIFTRHLLDRERKQKTI
jgi:iron only hydrogenase large subunit-like protein